METITFLLENVRDWIWGTVMIFLLVGTGVFLTFRLKGLQFRLLGYALKQAFGPHKELKEKDAEGDISHFAALMTALSATIGTGNIAGVAIAVVVGGPGAIFWMWITALFGMATKYGEAVLAVKYRVVDGKGLMAGGPMHYIEQGLKLKWLAILFAGFAMIASFGIGSSVQAQSVASSISASFNLPGWVTGVFLTILTGIVVLGGIKSIAKVSSVIVPVMAIIYILGSISIIVMHIDLLLAALNTIISDAFTGKAVAGGSLWLVIRQGVSRGLFSNEAGLGSAPIAAAVAKTDHPVRQALVSMTGTFLDTIVICSMTGIVLVMGMSILDTHGATGAALTTIVFNQLLPGPGGWIVTLGLIFFAYSTILGWSYYGEKCAEYLFGIRAVLYYRLFYVATVFIGAVATLDMAWLFADIFNGLMAFPNLIALLCLSGVIVKETHDFMNNIKNKEYKVSQKPAQL